jgi:hypothetical protein
MMPAQAPDFVAPPSSVMNSRRFMPDIGLSPASASSLYLTLHLPQRGRKVFGADLKRSEIYVGLPTLRASNPMIADHAFGRRSLHLGI